MRLMLSWTVPVEKGYETIRDGSLSASLHSLLEGL